MSGYPPHDTTLRNSGSIFDNEALGNLSSGKDKKILPTKKVHKCSTLIILRYFYWLMHVSTYKQQPRLKCIYMYVHM